MLSSIIITKQNEKTHRKNLFLKCGRPDVSMNRDTLTTKMESFRFPHAPDTPDRADSTIMVPTFTHQMTTWSICL